MDEHERDHATGLDPLQHAVAAHLAAADEEWNVDAAWSRVEQTISVRRTNRVRPRIAWAAVSALAAAAIFVVADLSIHRQTSTTTTRYEVTAANGKTANVRLPDGTRVSLNSGSSLRYGPDGRDVELRGEGYFEVVHDAAHPFRVRTRRGVVKDLGTRFVVRAYPEAAELEVAVSDGRVALESMDAGSQAATIDAGQVGRTEGARIAVDRGVDLERWVGWTHGVLVLDGLSLADAAVVLERHFDVTIAVSTPVRSRRVRARFHDESVESVMDAVTFALGVRWSRKGNGITVSP